MRNLTPAAALIAIAIAIASLGSCDSKEASTPTDLRVYDLIVDDGVDIKSADVQPAAELKVSVSSFPPFPGPLNMNWSAAWKNMKPQVTGKLTVSVQFKNHNSDNIGPPLRLPFNFASSESEGSSTQSFTSDRPEHNRQFHGAEVEAQLEVNGVTRRITFKVDRGR